MDLTVGQDFIDGMRRFGVRRETVAAAERRNQRVLGPCPASDGWGDFTCDLWGGHRGPHRESGVPWCSPGEQERWLETGDEEN